MIMKWLFCSQLIPRHIFTVLTELTFRHVSCIFARFPQFFSVVNDWLSLGCDLQSGCDFQLAFISIHIIRQEAILIMTTQELSHHLRVINL
ncbi:hypothetical protein D3C71_1416080 [compost metagenome]